MLSGVRPWTPAQLAHAQSARVIQSVRRQCTGWHATCFTWCMTMLLRDVSIRGTQSQDRVVASSANRRKQLQRYGLIGGIAIAALLLIAWSVHAWLSSDKVVPRARLRTGVV